MEKNRIELVCLLFTPSVCESMESMDKDNFFIKNQIYADLFRIKELINTGVFSANVLKVFQESAFTEIIIKLHDLLQKCNKLKRRIDFKNDILGKGDITDLVRNIRYAICHMDSGEHIVEGNNQVKFTFCIAYGKTNAFSINGKKFTSDYIDDMCFFFGENKIYLKRHIIKCIEELEKIIHELYSK